MDSRDNKRRKGDDSASISHDADGTDAVPNEEDERAEDDTQPQDDYEEIAAASDDNNKLLPERDEQQREANRRRARDIRKRKKKMVAEMQLKIAQLTMENQLLIQRTQMQQTVIEQLRANIQQQGTVQQLILQNQGLAPPLQLNSSVMTAQRTQPMLQLQNNNTNSSVNDLTSSSGTSSNMNDRNLPSTINPHTILDLLYQHNLWQNNNNSNNSSQGQGENANFFAPANRAQDLLSATQNPCGNTSGDNIAQRSKAQQIPNASAVTNNPGQLSHAHLLNLGGAGGDLIAQHQQSQQRDSSHDRHQQQSLTDSRSFSTRTFASSTSSLGDPATRRSTPSHHSESETQAKQDYSLSNSENDNILPNTQNGDTNRKRSF